MSETENNKVKAAKLRKRNNKRVLEQKEEKGLTGEEKPDGTVGR